MKYYHRDCYYVVPALLLALVLLLLALVLDLAHTPAPGLALVPVRVLVRTGPIHLHTCDLPLQSEHARL